MLNSTTLAPNVRLLCFEEVWLALIRSNANCCNSQSHRVRPIHKVCS